MSPRNAGWLVLVLLAGCTTSPGTPSPDMSPDVDTSSGDPESGSIDALVASGPAVGGTSVDVLVWPEARDHVMELLNLESASRLLPAGPAWTLVAGIKADIADDLTTPSKLLEHVIMVAIQGPIASEPQAMHAEGHWYDLSSFNPVQGPTRFFVASTYTTTDVLPRLSVQDLTAQARSLAGPLGLAVVQVEGIVAGAALPVPDIYAAAVMVTNASLEGGGIGVYTVPGIVLGMGQPAQPFGAPASLLGLFVRLDGTRLAAATQYVNDLQAADDVQAMSRVPGLPDLPATDINGLLQAGGANAELHVVPGVLIAIRTSPLGSSGEQSLQDLANQAPLQLVVPVETRGYVLGSTAQTLCLAAGGACTGLPFDVGFYDVIDFTLGPPGIYHIPAIWVTPRLGRTLVGQPVSIDGVWITQSLVRDAVQERVQAWMSTHDLAGAADAFQASQPWMNDVPGFLYVNDVASWRPEVAFPILATHASVSGTTVTVSWTPSLSPQFARYEVHQSRGGVGDEVVATITDPQILNATADVQGGRTFIITAVDTDGTAFTSKPLTAY